MVFPRHTATVAAIAIMIFYATTAGAQPLSSPSPLPLQNHLPISNDYASILSTLRFHELAKAEPSTVFAPSDASIGSCDPRSLPRLLADHTVPGLLPFKYLRNLDNGTELETLTDQRVTLTFLVNHATTETLFLNGVPITQPDLFHNGSVIVHGLDGVLHLAETSAEAPVPLMRLMLRDAVLRLRIAGYSIVALALRVKFDELVILQNMTLFALDDASIMSFGQSYVNTVRFHIVPNWFLSDLDLQRLPVTAVLPTLEPGQTLVVTTPGGGAPPPAEPMRINYVRIKSFDVMHNLRISVHALSLPFPHLHPPAAGGGGDAVARGV